MTAKTVLACGVGVPLLVGTLLMGGCGTPGTQPMEKIANAELAINRAQDSKAQDLAPLELRYAEDNLQKAKAAQKNGDYEKAIRFAEQALADAELAEAKAESEMARQTTKEMRDSIDALRKEIKR